MKITNLSKLDINELTQDQYDKLVDSGEVDENALYFVPQNPVEIIAYTLASSGWSGGVYSFESEYPVSKYDLQVEPNGDSITSDQLDAWIDAQPVGSATANQIKAMGDVPTVSIPVILKVVTL